MILRRIQIEGFKTLRNPVELKDLGLGIHLIHGPNETGKSTLLQAVARALFDRYNSNDQEIRSLRPWGTELAPRVVLELESGGKRFKLEKKFLDEESSTLSEWTGSKFERVADSVKADDKVRSWMLGTASKSGASSLGNWGLARLLWMTQTPSRMETPGLDESLRQHLLGVLGSAVLSETEQRLVAKLDRAYDIYYTAAKQGEKKGSPLHEARERLEKAEAALLVWKSKWDEISRLNETALESQARWTAGEKDRLALDLQIQELRVKAQEELERENLLKLKDQEHLALLSQWRSLNSAQMEVRNLEQAIAKDRATMEEKAPFIQEASLRITQAEAELGQATLQLEQATEVVSSLSRKMAQAALISETRALAAKVSELTAFKEQVLQLESELKAKKDEYSSRKRPKEAELQELRAWLGEAEGLRARILDLGMEVRFEAYQEGLRVDWISGDETQHFSPALGGEAVFKSSHPGELLIAGVGKIWVRSGAQDSEALKKRLQELERNAKARTEAFGVRSVEELQELMRVTSELAAQGKAVSASLAQALGTRFKSSLEVSHELERLTQDLNGRLLQQGFQQEDLSTQNQDFPEIRSLEASLAPAKAVQAEMLRIKAELEPRLRCLRAGLEAESKEQDHLRQRAELLGKQLAEKMGALGGKERLARELAEAALEKTGLESERAALSAMLPPLEARASLQLRLLEGKLEEARKLEEKARVEVLQATAVLANAEGQGYYSKLTLAEEECALASELVSQRQAQAQGTRLLRGLAHAKRGRMNSGLLAPIEEAVVDIFEAVRGGAGTDSPARLAFGADLHELGVKLAHSEALDRGALHTLSLGTQEQAMFAIRLAFGELLATRGDHPEAQLIVLDDPLVNADPGRQERARAILKRASQKLQILILTARPDDYRMLEPKEYDLAALKT